MVMVRSYTNGYITTISMKELREAVKVLNKVFGTKINMVGKGKVFLMEQLREKGEGIFKNNPQAKVPKQVVDTLLRVGTKFPVEKQESNNGKKKRRTNTEMANMISNPSNNENEGMVCFGKEFDSNRGKCQICLRYGNCKIEYTNFQNQMESDHAKIREVFKDLYKRQDEIRALEKEIAELNRQIEELDKIKF